MCFTVPVCRVLVMTPAVDGPVAMVSAATVQLYVVNGLRDAMVRERATEVLMWISPVSIATRVTS